MNSDRGEAIKPVPRLILFAGHAGTGKTTLAKRAMPLISARTGQDFFFLDKDTAYGRFSAQGTGELPFAGHPTVGAAVVVALNDPAAPGSWFPPCLFHRTTGLWCPGCGLTRAAHALLNGHPVQAVGYNLFAPLVFLAIGLSWLTWTRQAFGRPMANPIMRLPSRAHTGLIVAIVALARNSGSLA